MASLSLLSLLILSYLSLSASLSPPPDYLLNAVDTLANSGYTAMSLTLQLIANSLPLPSATTTTALTIFSPPNSAFSANGQPSLAHLLLHFSPLSLSSSSLLSLPFSSSIPTLSPSKHLFVTSSSSHDFSINGVKISQSPLFDDGWVVVYAIDDFFDLNFTLANYTKTDHKTDFQCLKLERVSRFQDASGVLKSRGYSIIASFLDLQIMGFLDQGDFTENNLTKWTLFSPADQDLVRFSGDFLVYSSLLMRHLVPCKVSWSDLDEMVNGTVVSNNVQGFSLEITKDEDNETLMVNGVVITAPDLYESESLVIHGIQRAISEPDNGDEEFEFMEDLSEHEFEVPTSAYHGEL
ncbi:fasciclin-like arabinogalactan protein 20 [Dorcoceras hygrometricum]|uniref:Fasciclin-like arabinogalactan protein 20 n=1 Tax=Dorcoceras hygrometricum TaxID=472368 RepID=A0A2Z7AJU4_9LAMI|nr:fasciclin-like arabinogalactan protein 20 [Dorcoceras hygrometricum]